MSQSIINGPPKGCGIKKPMNVEIDVVVQDFEELGETLQKIRDTIKECSRGDDCTVRIKIGSVRAVG